MAKLLMEPAGITYQLREWMPSARCLHFILIPQQLHNKGAFAREEAAQIARRLGYHVRCLG